MPQNIPDSKTQDKESRCIEVKITERETAAVPEAANESPQSSEPLAEIGGPKGLEPTRYGDWEVNGRCSDF